MISDTKIDNLLQMNIRDWPNANYESVASINTTPSLLNEHTGIIFYETEEQLGNVRTAYLKYNDLYIQLMFLDLEPTAGTYININNILVESKVDLVNKTLALLGMKESDVIWRS